MGDGLVRLRVNGFLLPPIVDTMRRHSVRSPTPVQASGPSTHRSSINNSITVRANYQTLPFNRVVPCDSIPNTVIIVLRETIVSTVGEHPSDFFHGEVVPPFSIVPAEYSNRNGRFRISVSCVIHIINRFIGSFFLHDAHSMSDDLK